MDFIKKISLKESNEKEKDAVLYDAELTDKQKVVLYNEILKKLLLRKPNKAKTEMKLLSHVWLSIENLPTAQ